MNTNAPCIEFLIVSRALKLNGGKKVDVPVVHSVGAVVGKSKGQGANRPGR